MSTMREVYVICGASGDRHWIAGACVGQAQARTNCARLEQWCAEHEVDCPHAHSVSAALVCPLDDQQEIDHRWGVGYHIEPVTISPEPTREPETGLPLAINAALGMVLDRSRVAEQLRQIVLRQLDRIRGKNLLVSDDARESRGWEPLTLRRALSDLATFLETGELDNDELLRQELTRQLEFRSYVGAFTDEPRVENGMPPLTLAEAAIALADRLDDRPQPDRLRSAMVRTLELLDQSRDYSATSLQDATRILLASLPPAEPSPEPAPPAPETEVTPPLPEAVWQSPAREAPVIVTCATCGRTAPVEQVDAGGGKLVCVECQGVKR